MKSLIKKIARSDVGINVRNFIGFRPIWIRRNREYRVVSVSDAFLWRTDNGFKTTFKYSDILGLFYKIKDSYVELVFYSKDNNLIKRIIINRLDYSNELLIDRDFLNGIEGYGVFYIFHRSDSDCGDDLVISNRCYVGFSMEGSLSSFVHGNLYVRYQSLDGKYGGSGMIQSSFFKNLYRIQNSFVEFKKSELFFVNPTSKKLNFSIGLNKYSLEKGCSILIDVSGKEEISILSKCLFLRPVIFNYKDCFFDVYHG
ncbi:hypothetical protein HOB87_02145 [Candidatus Woesearchaeota archaeon]|jgi:hypothetical protein|nr:hypothetical protein [Candidatus Woesearchaeota archaeon]